MYLSNFTCHLCNQICLFWLIRPGLTKGLFNKGGIEIL